jgi:hypothetical protein
MKVPTRSYAADYDWSWKGVLARASVMTEHDYMMSSWADFPTM